ncbi:MAG TPA: nucleoside-diphosphate kinase [Pararhizobium sp.]|nr:nucleoside-diphosphate kinase [Pararhizobium sp.]
MSEESFILTNKDFTFLEAMLTRCSALGDPMLPLLRCKLENARVVPSDDVPPDVATMSSRVSFSINGRAADTRIISHDRMTSPIGLFLPVTTARGMALLGLAEGQAFRLSHHNGTSEQIVLERVLYQPEAAGRRTDAVIRLVEEKSSRPVLRLVDGGNDGKSKPVGRPGPGGFDDPGPSAA